MALRPTFHSAYTNTYNSPSDSSNDTPNTSQNTDINRNYLVLCRRKWDEINARRQAEDNELLEMEHHAKAALRSQKKNEEQKLRIQLQSFWAEVDQVWMDDVAKLSFEQEKEVYEVKWHQAAELEACAAELGAQVAYMQSTHDKKVELLRRCHTRALGHKNIQVYLQMVRVKRRERDHLAFLDYFMECRYDRLNLLVSQRIKALEETRNHEDNVFKDQMLLLLDKKANELSDISLPEMVDAGRSDFILHVNNMLAEEFNPFAVIPEAQQARNMGAEVFSRRHQCAGEFSTSHKGVELSWALAHPTSLSFKPYIAEARLKYLKFNTTSKVFEPYNENDVCISETYPQWVIQPRNIAKVYWSSDTMAIFERGSDCLVDVNNGGVSEPMVTCRFGGSPAFVLWFLRCCFDYYPDLNAFIQEDNTFEYGF